MTIDPAQRFPEAHPFLSMLDRGPVVLGDEGTYPYCVVLVDRGRGPHDRYVVWTLIMPADRPAYCVWGDYHHELAPARRRFDKLVRRDAGQIERDIQRERGA